jgi:glycosyltransferase involved in cell wall biosynthesis
MSANSPLVSVLVPTYNAAPFLPELCESIQTQTYRNLEVLILNDGSSDNTLAVVEPYRKDARFRIFSWNQNRGVNPATSTLLNLAKGEYWCIPNADDVLYPGFVAQRLNLLEAHLEAAMVHGPGETIDESGRRINDEGQPLKLPCQTEGTRALAMLLQHNVISTSSVLVRTSVTRLVLPFFLCNWKYAEDWYLWLLHAATGFDLLWDVQPLHKYRLHAASLSNISTNASFRRAATRLAPLCALSAAAQFSQLAADYWSRWRTTLYCLWLLRALRLRFEGLLREPSLRLAGHAYYGASGGGASLPTELCKHSLGILLATLKERQALKRQSFKVSGLAQIDDPVFR